MISWLQNIEFEHPWFFLLLGLIPIVIFWKYYRSSNYEFFFPLPTIAAFQKSRTWRSFLYSLLPWLRMLAYIMLVIAIARPRLALKEEVEKAEGIDIMMIIDLSSSMLARDFDPDRLEASKRVASEFIENRKYDRIGLSVFSGEAFTLCPLTADHHVLLGMIKDVEAGILTDGTAIGNGLAAAVNRLKDSPAESKVAILLTDGVNNRGFIEPETAVQIARDFNIKVYTIGVGTNGLAQTPVGRNRQGNYYYDYIRVNIDESLLKNIAKETGGRYYRATSEEELKDVYNAIDVLEKTEIELNVFKRYSEEFEYFVWLGLGLFLFELLLRFTVLKTMPV